jgi:hypothetical protein
VARTNAATSRRRGRAAGALEARPDHAGARTLLALVLLRQGRVDDARARDRCGARLGADARDALLVGRASTCRRRRGAARGARAASAAASIPTNAGVHLL